MIWWCQIHEEAGDERSCCQSAYDSLLEQERGDGSATYESCSMVEALLIVKENAVKGQIWYTNQRRYEIDAEQPVMPGTYYIVPVDALASVGDSQ